MKLSAILTAALLGLVTSPAWAVPICVAYDANNNCTLWEDSGGGNVGVPIPTGGSCTTVVCVAYDANGNCTESICQ